METAGTWRRFSSNCRLIIRSHPTQNNKMSRRISLSPKLTHTCCCCPCLSPEAPPKRSDKPTLSANHRAVSEGNQGTCREQRQERCVLTRFKVNRRMSMHRCRCAVGGRLTWWQQGTKIPEAAKTCCDSNYICSNDSPGEKRRKVCFSLTKNDFKPGGKKLVEAL